MKRKIIIFFLTISLVLFFTHFNFSQANDDLGNKLKGRILLQVESKGEAWYVNPKDDKRHYMANGDEAYKIMRNLGIGVTTKDLERIKADNNFAKQYGGKIFLQVEAHGEAFYIDVNGYAHYLKNGAEAYNIMRDLGLGITNSDLNKIIASGDYYSVIRVVDGDTIVVDINGNIEKLRLIGLDTPETVDPRKPVQCFGVEASNKAKELLEGKKVKLENDISQGERDKYNRLLRYVYLEDGTLFNKLMIESGYGHEYTYVIPYKYQEEFMKAETYARENNLGLWNPDVCNFENQNESNTTGQIFYTSGYWSSELYYCENDLAWKGLSEKYLELYSSEAELLKVHPHKTLHEPCK